MTRWRAFALLSRTASLRSAGESGVGSRELGVGASPRVAVVGATGYAGALAASVVHQHPSLELAAITARSETGVPHMELYARYRVPLAFEQFDADAIAERADAALVALPHGAAAPS